MRTDLSSGKAIVKSQGKSCYRIKRQRGAKSGPSNNLAKTTTEPSVSLAKSPPPTSTSTSPPATPGAPGATTELILSPSVHNHPPNMVQQLTHLNDTARCMQHVLSDIRSHVYEVMSLQPDWQQSRTSKVGLISGNDYSSYDHFVLAMDSFLRNEHTSGGEILRQAFLKVEEAITTDYSCIFYFFFIDLPDLFLQYGRHDILNILLGHVKRLTGAVGLRERIPGVGLAGLHTLVETDPASLRHYISAASSMWCDLLSDLRGPRDRSTLLSRRNCLRHDRGADYRHRVRRLCEDYDLLLDEVREQYGEGHDMSSHMEDVSLSVQMSHDFFMDNFVVQNETLINNVEAKYRAVLPPIISELDTSFGHVPFPGQAGDVDVPDPSSAVTTMLPLGKWDVLDRTIRSNCYHRLSSYFHLQGDLDRSFRYGRKACEGWRGNFWQLESEMALMAAGRRFEAEALRRVRLEQQYFGKLPNNYKLLFEREEHSRGAEPGIEMLADSWAPISVPYH